MSGHGKNESFDDWLARKAAKKDKPKPILGRQSGLNRGSPLKKTRLNPVSKKGKKRAQEYKKARDEHYSDEANRKCAVCGRPDALSIHHIAKRGDNTSRTETFITLCLMGSYLSRLHPELNPGSGGCHGFIEANKGWARENGYLE